MKKRNKMARIIFIITLCFVFFGCTIAALEIYSSSFGRVEEFPENEFFPYHRYKEIDQYKYPREEVHFNSCGNKLQGFIYGNGNNNGLVVISEGLGGTADDYLPMIMYFAGKGWRVFAFNNTGVSGSEGESVRGLSQSVIDLDAALTYIENSDKFAGLSVMLAGHSWGGHAVCAVLNYNHRVSAVVSFAGYNKGSDMIKENGVSMVGGFFYIFTPQMRALEKQLFGDTANLTAVGGINKSGIPVMIVQCSDDNAIKPGTTSIYAHRKEITNPHVEIIYRDGEDATGHEYTFCSKAQKEYYNWANKSWETYKAENKNATKLQWANVINFDKDLVNELDPDLMERINVLYNNAK
ncbi:MAG: alpha/beta hydrolase [Treponema sp.]|jgi:dienelactone hydrolase|nr:alpha/beta hydrolase [Treponema sp.]